MEKSFETKCDKLLSLHVAVLPIGYWCDCDHTCIMKPWLISVNPTRNKANSNMAFSSIIIFSMYLIVCRHLCTWHVCLLISMFLLTCDNLLIHQIINSDNGYNIPTARRTDVYLSTRGSVNLSMRAINSAGNVMKKTLLCGSSLLVIICRYNL